MVRTGHGATLYVSPSARCAAAAPAAAIPKTIKSVSFSTATRTIFFSTAPKSTQTMGSRLGPPFVGSSCRNRSLPAACKRTRSSWESILLSADTWDSLSERKDLNSLPFREVSLHLPCSICAIARKPSHLISKSQSGCEKADCFVAHVDHFTV